MEERRVQSVESQHPAEKLELLSCQPYSPRDLYEIRNLSLKSSFRFTNIVSELVSVPRE